MYIYFFREIKSYCLRSKIWQMIHMKRLWKKNQNVSAAIVISVLRVHSFCMCLVDYFSTLDSHFNSKVLQALFISNLI